MGLQLAERNVGNNNKYTFRNYGTPIRRTRRRKSRKDALSELLGLGFADQSVRNLKKIHVQKLWDSGSQNKTSEISIMHFQKLWGSGSQNKASEISKMSCHQSWDSCSQNNTSDNSSNALSEILGLLFAEQNV